MEIVVSEEEDIEMNDNSSVIDDLQEEMEHQAESGAKADSELDTVFQSMRKKSEKEMISTIKSIREEHTSKKENVEKIKEGVKEMNTWHQQMKKFLRENSNPYIERAIEYLENDRIDKSQKAKHAEKFFRDLSELFFERFQSNLKDWREDLIAIFSYTKFIEAKFEELDYTQILSSMRALEDDLAGEKQWSPNEEQSETVNMRNKK